jgi:hypothetical protein
VTPASLGGRSVVIINDATRLSAEAEAALGRFVNAGGGLLIVLGERTPWQGESPLMPGILGAPVDRLRGGGATLGFIDHAHPIFEQFKDPRTGNFAAVRFYKYRSIAPAATDRALARFDDGAAAIVERLVGSGRVIALASTLDQSWNDFATRPMFLPLVHETVRYLGQYQEPEAWYTVGRMLDVSVPVAAIVREGAAGEVRTAAEPGGVVMAPSGRQTTFGEGGIRAVELAEQGFYSARLQGVGDRRPFNVAVNLDPAESDLTPMVAAEFAANATGQAGLTPAGQSLEHPELTAEDLEKKQSIWWYLFAIGAGLLLAEAVLANRLSKRLGFALS